METEKTTRLKAFEFLCNNKLAVLGTLSPENLPECAVLYYVVSGKEIYQISRINTSKIQNIATHPKVSFVVFQENPPIELQIQGTASVINEPTQKAQIASLYLETANKNSGLQNWPPVMKLLDSGRFEFIKISVDTFKFSDFTNQEAVIVKGTVDDWI